MIGEIVQTAVAVALVAGGIVGIMMMLMKPGDR